MNSGLKSVKNDLEATIAGFVEKRASLLDLKRNSIVDALAEVRELWTPGSSWFQGGVRLSEGFLSEKAAQLALSALFDNLDPVKLRSALSAEIGPVDEIDDWRLTGPNRAIKVFPLGVVTQILPGNHFMTGVLALIHGLLTKNSVLLKPSQKGNQFLEFFYDSLQERLSQHRVGRILMENVKILRWSREDELANSVIRSRSDGIVVWGTSSAVAAFSQDRCAGRVISYGPRLGLAVVSRSCESTQVTDQLAWDIALWEQKACSSPRLIFVEDDLAHARSHEFGARLKFSLEAIANQLKPPHLDLDSKAEVLSIRERVYWQKESLLLSASGDFDQTVVWSASPPEMVPVGYRIAIIVPYRNIEELAGYLRIYRPFLQTATLAAGQVDLTDYESLLFRSGVTQIIGPGVGIPGELGSPHEGDFFMRSLTKVVSKNFQKGTFSAE